MHLQVCLEFIVNILNYPPLPTGVTCNSLISPIWPLSQGTANWIGMCVWMWGQLGFEPHCACLCFWGLWGSRECLMAQREGCSHMQREAGGGIKRESARAHQGFVSAISGLTSILAQDSLEPNAESPALLMLAWVHFCYFSADCHIQNCFSGSLSLIYRWKWAMRYDLGPHSPIFAEPLARLREDRDEQHRVLYVLHLPNPCKSSENCIVGKPHTS